MNEWAGFYERLFNFRQIRYFDIEGKLTGLHSRAMTSPDGKIRIPSTRMRRAGQIEEYLKEYKGEGIQHVALGSATCTSPSRLSSQRGRVHADPERSLLRPHRQAPAEARRGLERLRRNGILIDGEGVVEGGSPRSCCSASGRRRSARSSSSSSSARATTASARATSRRCSSRSRKTRSAAAC
jgi:4-hydroxyphenylpyruvate dioxygenase